MTHVRSVWLWYYLVGGWALHIWKMMEFVSWDDDIPNMMEKYKRFQTTNQWDIYIYIYLYVYGWLWMYMGYSGNDAIILSKKNNNNKQYATSVFLHQLVIWSKNHFVIAESLGFPRVSGLTSIWLRTSACFARSRGYLPVAIPRSSERAENGSPVPKLQVPLWIPLVIQHSYWTWA